MDKKDVRQYLSGIDADRDEKNFAMDFYTKSIYLDNLLQETNVKDESYGNLNASVAFIFKSREQFNKISDKLEMIIKRMQMDMWEFYVTFIDKGVTPDNMKYMVLNSEMTAVMPKAAYVFCSNDDYINITSMPNVPVSYRIDPNLFDEDDGMKKIWNEMKFIINIKRKIRRT